MSKQCKDSLHHHKQWMMLVALMKPMMLWCGVAFLLCLYAVQLAGLPLGNLKANLVFVFAFFYGVAWVVGYLHQRMIKKRGINIAIEDLIGSRKS